MKKHLAAGPALATKAGSARPFPLRPAAVLALSLLSALLAPAPAASASSTPDHRRTSAFAMPSAHAPPAADRPLDRALGVARGIDVSARKAAALLRISRNPAFRPELFPALAAAASITSERPLAELLATVAAEHRLDADAREAYLRTASGIPASGAARALAALLAQEDR